MLLVVLLIYTTALEANSVIGNSAYYKIKNGDTLIDLAVTFGVGYNEIVLANEGVDEWLPEVGKKILVPKMWVLPGKLKEGIIINLAEMRLYYFYTNSEGQYVKTYPIGIGRDDAKTPIGSFKVTGKIKNPTWRPPPTVRKMDPNLPDLVPPGPENPLGEYWIELSAPSYGIHGTNKPPGVGRRVSSGCIRLYPRHIKALFESVQVGAPVIIADKPVKIGARGGDLYMEVHKKDQSSLDLLDLAINQLQGKGLLDKADKKKMLNAIINATGLPTIISW